MESYDKYKLFKNFMHNELGITKEDIRLWIKDSVHEEARRLVAEEFEKFDIKKILNNLAYEDIYWGNKQLQSDCRKLMMELLASKFELVFHNNQKEST